MVVVVLTLVEIIVETVDQVVVLDGVQVLNLQLLLVMLVDILLQKDKMVVVLLLQ